MGKSNLEFLHDLLVRLDSRLDEMNDTLIRHDENLEEHMSRSKSNEESLALLKTYVDRVNGVVAFVVFLSVVASIYAAVR